MAKTDDDLVSTIEALGLVRKGRMCAYVLGVKGSNAQTLIVRKKITTPKDLAKAREGGNSVVWGLAVGQGAKITFYVAKSDGHTDLPLGGKTDKLKTFLNDLTADQNQKWLPELLLVDEPPARPFDEDELKNPLVQRFLALGNVAQKVEAGQPMLQAPIATHVKTIRRLLDDPAAAQETTAKLDEFETALKAWLAAAPQPSTADPNAQPTAGKPDSNDSQALKLAEQLKKLRTLGERVIAGDASRKDEIVQYVARIAGLIKSQDFQQANDQLLAFGKLLQNALGGSPPKTAESDELVRYSQRRQLLEPRLLEAQRAAPDQATKLGAVWTFAEGLANTAKYGQAHKALDGLEQALDKILAQAPRSDAERLGIRAGLVADRINELEDFITRSFAALQQQSDQEIARLRDAMQPLIPEDADDFRDQILRNLEATYEEARGDLLQAVHTGLRDQIVAAVDRWKQQIANHELINHLATSRTAVGADTTIHQRFAELFDKTTAEVERVAVA